MEYHLRSVMLGDFAEGKIRFPIWTTWIFLMCMPTDAHVDGNYQCVYSNLVFMKTFAQSWSSWYTISIFALQLWTNEDMRLIYFPTRKSGPKITLIQFGERFNKLKENAGKRIAIRCKMISFVQKWKKYVIIDSYDNFFQRWRQEFEIRRSCFACGNFQYQNISIWMKLLWRNNEFVCKVFDWWITPSPSCSNSYFFFFRSRALQNIILWMSALSSARAVSSSFAWGFMQKWESFAVFLHQTNTAWRERRPWQQHHLWLCGFLPRFP